MSNSKSVSVSKFTKWMVSVSAVLVVCLWTAGSIVGCSGGGDDDNSNKTPYYNISFDAKGGTSVTQKTNIKHGDTIMLPSTSRSGYTFDGWYSLSTDARVGGANDYIIVYGNATLYASWIKKWGSSNNDGDARTINGIACVLVKNGTFAMGEGALLVTLKKDYWISKYPITQAQYRAVVGYNPSHFKGDDKPVESVTWSNAVAFCQAVDGRLPTEAEWEFAALGGNKSKGYKYSGSNILDSVGWYNCIPSVKAPTATVSVGKKKPNELGIYDMSGNVLEWCSDWYGSYPKASVVDPLGPSNGTRRVYRGGYWNSDSIYCRVAYRDYSQLGTGKGTGYGVVTFGFRVVFNAN